MNTMKLVSSSLTAVMSLMLMNGTLSAADHEHAVKTGKTGELTLSQPTRVGSLTLAPGKYKFQHRTAGSEHFVHFTQMTGDHGYYVSSPAEKGHPGEVPCEVEPVDKKVAQTRLLLRKEGEAMRLIRVEVSGENVAHLL